MRLSIASLRLAGSGCERLRLLDCQPTRRPLLLFRSDLIYELDRLYWAGFLSRQGRKPERSANTKPDQLNEYQALTSKRSRDLIGQGQCEGHEPPSKRSPGLENCHSDSWNCLSRLFPIFSASQTGFRNCSVSRFHSNLRVNRSVLGISHGNAAIEPGNGASRTAEKFGGSGVLKT